MERSPHLNLAKSYWEKHLAPGDPVIDATAGNGKDTLFLAQLGCAVFALDIQEAALLKTQALLDKYGANATILRMSHDDLRKVPCPRPRLIVYNLGYLPGGDKSVTTQTESTFSSIQSGVEILDPGGALSITCYPGHPEGKREEEALAKWAGSLQGWDVRHHRWENRPLSPSLLWIVRIENP